MDTWQRRTALYVSALALVMLGYTAAYHYGMTTFEGESVSIFHSLQVVVETFTTTGFGSDSPWESDAMNLLVVVMDLTGVALIFLALPVLLFPMFEEALSTTVPTAVEEDLDDHVIICTHTPRAEALIDELEYWDVDYVLLEPDRDRATDLYEGGFDVIHREPDSVAGLERAGLTRARALVADVSDEVDASIVLTAKEVAAEVPVVSVVEEPDRARYHELAGADHVLSPRPLLGESLAYKVTTAVNTDLGDTIEVGEDFDIVEFPIRYGSDLVGKTLAESGLRERAGVNVIGAWYRGEFESPPSPDVTLDSETILLVTGERDQLERLKELTLAEGRRFTGGSTVVVGYGEVGRTITEVLDAAGQDYTVVDREDLSEVDVVGDATDPEVLETAGVADAQSVILAIPDDTAAEFATLVLCDLSDSVEIVARAEAEESIRKLYRAGADYVLSLATVSGRMLASAILEEDVVALDRQVEVARVDAGAFGGDALAEADIRRRTGCTVIAVERDGDFVTDLGPDFRIEPGDAVIVAGTDDAVNRYTELAAE